MPRGGFTSVGPAAVGLAADAGILCAVEASSPNWRDSRREA
jgi:hypothetical protein